MADKIKINLFFAFDALTIHQQVLECDIGTTVEQALSQSGIKKQLPNTYGMAIFGKKCTPETILEHGDRIELCRDLSFDPKDSRRRRAEHRQDGILKRKHLKKSKAAYIKLMQNIHEETNDGSQPGDTK